jgi:ADP-heptose:LPS heptosyltransferase
MSARRRWTPVKGTGNRVYDPRERWLLRAADLPGRLLFSLRARPRSLPPGEIREVLVLRLDRIGDLLMCFPALQALREALPGARVRLAVGTWAEELARRAPVDEVLVWSAPWVGRAAEGAQPLPALLRSARRLASERVDLAVDLQGDVRAAWLMWLTGARMRVGYANTGGAYLLTRVVPLDETVSWVEQNLRAVAAAVGQRSPVVRSTPLRPGDAELGRRLLGELARPIVGIHPSGGRRIKQWPVARWVALAERLAAAAGASFVVTGGPGDAALAGELAAAIGAPVRNLAGQIGLMEMLALVSQLDLFLSPDTGPMHVACAVGTPSVSVFGPSDPVRYFSGGSGARGGRHVVVGPDLWCAPCNRIRRPPAECLEGEAPECLRSIDVAAVAAAALELLARGAEP